MQILRYLLFPVSLLYGVITWLRNKLFDWGIWKQTPIPYPSICVGNLSTGGTGKTPHVLMLNQWFSDENNITIISRGYGRKTKGLVLADQTSNAETIGDEPMLFHTASPQPQVIVTEKRVRAISKLKEKKRPNTLVLLDDAFQHRHVKAGVNLLLTDYNKPYFRDFLLPTGNLREFKSGQKRADYVIVTKCPNTLSDEEKNQYTRRIDLPQTSVYFSTIVYSDWTPLSNCALPIEIEKIVLVTGIANPKPLEEHLSQNFSLKSVIFPDHHAFTRSDIQHIHEIFGNFASDKTILLTSEKDAVRLQAFAEADLLKDFPWFVQKMSVRLDREDDLKEKLKNYVRTIQ